MRKCRGIYKNESGSITVMFLILIPLLFTIMIGVIQFTNTITTSDISVQESIATSVKAAAQPMNLTSQADGIIRINTDMAHANFIEVLQDSLGLDATLTPITGVYTDKPEYWLLVYNGYNDYAGCETARIFHFDGTNLTQQDILISGFPATFSINNTGIVTGNVGDYTVELETPGVIGLIKISSSNITNKSHSTITRWGSARIVGTNGSFRVI